MKLGSMGESLFHNLLKTGIYSALLLQFSVSMPCLYRAAECAAVAYHFVASRWHRCGIGTGELIIIQEILNYRVMFLKMGVVKPCNIQKCSPTISAGHRGITNHLHKAIISYACEYQMSSSLLQNIMEWRKLLRVKIEKPASAAALLLPT